MLVDQEFTLRPFRSQQDWRAVRMLLPDAVNAGEQSDVLVATDREARIVAALAMSKRMYERPILGPLVAVHVIPPARRRGIARSFITAAEKLAKSRGAAALLARGAAEVDSPEALAWRSLGFDQQQTMRETMQSVAEVERVLTPLFDVMRRRGRVPDDVAMLDLADADLQQVVAIQEAQLGGERNDLLSRLTGKRGGVDMHLSKVLVRCDPANGSTTVLGYLIGTFDPNGVPVVASNYVAPEVRGTWANVWLKLAAAQSGVARGVPKLKYETYDEHGDSRKFEERIPGSSSRTLVQQYKNLHEI